MDTEIARGLSRPTIDSLRESVSRALRGYAEKDGRGYPDWAMRYAPIVRRLRLDRDVCEPILEIGANENGLARFAKRGARIVAVDVSPAHLNAARKAQCVSPVAADIAHLPFADDAFGVVVAVDTLEHVAPAERPASLNEFSRVLSPQGRAALSFPSGAHAGDAEAALSRAYRDATGRSIRWLDEHNEYGLPNTAETAAVLCERLGNSHRIDTKGNANLGVWKAIWRVLLFTWPRRGNALAQAALRLATPLLTRAHWGRCYRAILYMEPSDD